MKNSKIINVTEISNSELVEINGGGFAYDVGRAIRFSVLCGPNCQNMGYAIADWYAN